MRIHRGPGDYYVLIELGSRRNAHPVTRRAGQFAFDSGPQVADGRRCGRVGRIGPDGLAQDGHFSTTLAMGTTGQSGSAARAS